MLCNVSIVTGLTPLQVSSFVNNNRLVGDEVTSVTNNLILNGVKEFMRQNTGYSVTPITCVSRIGGQSADLNLGVDVFMPALAGQIRSGNFLLQLKTCADAVCSISLQDYLWFCQEFESADASDAQYLNEDLFDTMKIGSLDSEENVVSFVPFISGEYLQYFTKIEDNWVQSSLKIERGLEAIKTKLMVLR